MLLPQKGLHPDTRVADLKNPISPPYYLRAGFLWDRLLARISHHLSAEARNRPAITSLRLLAVLDVLSSTPPLVKRRAPRTDGPLTHFASPRGEKCRLDCHALRVAPGHPRQRIQ